MRKSMVSLLSLVLLAGPVLGATSATAGNCEGMREFTGKIQGFKKSGRKAGFLLDNNQGDKVRFQKADTVEIIDQRSDKKAASWEDLKNGNWVGACWKFTDKPRLAYKVVVQDPPKDSATDE